MSDIEVLSYSFTVEPQHNGETYHVQRSSDGVSGWITVSYTNNQSLNDAGLAIHTEYFYRVRMWDDTAEEWSLWSDPMSGTTQYAYDVRYSLAGQDVWTTAAATVDGYVYDIESLASDTEYDVAVRAFDGTNYSEWSIPVSGTTDTGIPADVTWLAPPADSTIDSTVDLITETTDERVTARR
jgi:hypothetical protein